MAAETRLRRSLAGSPNGSDELSLRVRYLHQRRRLDARGLTTLWITVVAVMGWLFIAGFAGLGH